MTVKVREDIKDEVIAELWEIKERMASSCGGDMSVLVEKMNEMAAQQKDLGEEVSLRNRS